MARDQNYMTHEEAGRKCCPFMSRNSDNEVRCETYACMAWRWHEYQVPIPENERTGPNIWKKETSMTYGRCGMVPL